MQKKHLTQTSGPPKNFKEIRNRKEFPQPHKIHLWKSYH